MAARALNEPKQQPQPDRVAWALSCSALHTRRPIAPHTWPHRALPGHLGHDEEVAVVVYVVGIRRCLLDDAEPGPSEQSANDFWAYEVEASDARLALRLETPPATFGEQVRCRDENLAIGFDDTSKYRFLVNNRPNPILPSNSVQKTE